MGPRALLKRYLFEGDVLRLMGLTFLIKPVGLVTQMLVARYFGAGEQYDAYALTLFLVQFLDNLVGQSFNTVFLPLAIRRRATMPRDSFLRFQNFALLIFLGPVVLYLLVLLLRGEWIVGLVAPNLPAETRAYVDRMIPWMVGPGLALMTVSMLKAVLNQNRRFSVAGSMPLLGGLIILGTLVLLQGRLGIWALPAGFAAGNLAQLVVVVLFALGAGCLAFVRPAAPAGGLRELWSLGWVFLLSQLVMTLGMAVDRYFATGLEVGSVSSLAYSTSILNMGTQLFSFSLTIVMFTRMSEFISAGDMSACNAYIRDNLTRQSRLVVPLSLGLALAAPEIVRVLFQRGAFGPEDTLRTSGVVMFHLLALPAMVTNGLVARIYHSLQKLRDRIWLNAQYVATLVLCSFLLVGPLRVKGLAVAAAIAINLHLALSFYVLHRYRAGLRVGGLAAILLRNYLLAAVAFSVYVVSGFAGLLAGWEARGSLAGAVAVGAAKVAFIAVVFYAGYLAWRRYDRRKAVSA